MDIVELTAQHEDSYLMCLEDWSSEMQEAGDHKARWYRTMRERGDPQLAASWILPLIASR